MLITKYIEVKWASSNRKHFESLGYAFTYKGDVFTIPIEHLNKGSELKVEVKCDYCGEKITKPYKKYLKHREITSKDSCNKRECKDKKRDESVMTKYGVEHYSQTDEYKEKFKETSMENWGTEHPMQNKDVQDKLCETFINNYGTEYFITTDMFKEKVQNIIEEKYNGEHWNKTEEVQNKIKATNLEKYGVEWYLQSEDKIVKSKNTNLKKYGAEYPMQSDDVIDKRRDNNLNKYGVINVSQLDETKEKVKQTNLDRYGVEQTFQYDEFNKKRLSTWMHKYGTSSPMKAPEVKQKALRTLYKNGTAPTSKQQLYLHNLIGGELNYPFSNCMIDIAFPDKMIAIEYDGGGHDLQVKHGTLTEEEFKDKDIKREMFLRSKGWKIIRITSLDDYLPTDNTIKKLINEAIKYFDTTGHTWFTIDIDNKLIKCIEYERSYSFRKLQIVKGE